MDPKELNEHTRIARRYGMTLSEWTRHALRLAKRQAPSWQRELKLSAVREALMFDAPAPDIDVMLKEIEQGYLKD